VPYGPRFHVDEFVDTCRRCGESGDFANRNETLIDEKKAEAVKASVVSMLAALSDSGITMAYFERALSLPARTLARWKEGQLSASGAALLRLVRTYPWLLEVADEGFDQRHANVMLMQGAAAVVAQYIPAQSLAWASPVQVPSEQTRENNFTLTSPIGHSLLGSASSQPAASAQLTNTRFELVAR